MTVCPGFKNRGFSLIEIMVAIGIIALIGAISIPNLRRFSSEQEVDSAALQVLNTLKTAQSSAISRVRCPTSTNGEVTNSWKVRLTNTNYSLIAGCETGDQTVFTRSYDPPGQTGFTGEINVCSNSTTDVIFTRNEVNYMCDGSPAVQSGPVILTIRNGDLSKVVKVEPGGVIKNE